MAKEQSKVGEAKAEDEKVRVRVDVTARGTVTLEMTVAEFEERFPEDGEPTCVLEDLVTDWHQAVEGLEFEIEDAYLADDGDLTPADAGT